MSAREPRLPRQLSGVGHWSRRSVGQGRRMPVYSVAGARIECLHSVYTLLASCGSEFQSGVPERLLFHM
jgi:hypothetical protein